MVAVAKLRTPITEEADTISEEANTEEDVLIHVRYLPNADVFSIDACPENLSPREWLNRLLEIASDRYQTLAGGRGFFRIPRSRLDAVLSQDVK